MIEKKGGGQAKNESSSSPESSDDYGDWYEPGTLVPVDKEDATDVLVLSLHIDGLISNYRYKLGYRKLTKREQVHVTGRGMGMSADGKKGYFGLSVNEEQIGPITADKFQIAIRYYGAHEGKRYKGNETITVPVGKNSDGVSGNLKFELEWKKGDAKMSPAESRSTPRSRRFPRSTRSGSWPTPRNSR